MRSLWPTFFAVLAGAHLGGCGRSSLGADDLTDPSSNGPEGEGGAGGRGTSSSDGPGGCAAQAERCDGIDNNCDGHIDDPADDVGQPCATNLPGGCGRGTTTCLGGVLSCEPVPASREVCDGLDNDCNGVQDDPLALGCRPHFRDADQDGFGATDDVQCLCAPAFPYTTEVPGDCDDAASDVTPRAVELCNDRDDDCDGRVDEDGLLCACSAVSFGGHEYLLCPTPASWSDALAACAEAGYGLVIVSDADEDAFVFEAANEVSHEKWWIGLNDIVQENNFVWQDGSPVTYTNWWPDEPNNSGGDEDCCQINRYYPDGGWNDEPCTIRLFFICERG